MATEQLVFCPETGTVLPNNFIGRVIASVNNGIVSVMRECDTHAWTIRWNIDWEPRREDITKWTCFLHGQKNANETMH